MITMDNEKVYICLADGHIFEGKRFGAGGNIEGELVFTTGMCGYIETLTDQAIMDRSFLDISSYR